MFSGGLQESPCRSVHSRADGALRYLWRVIRKDKTPSEVLDAEEADAEKAVAGEAVAGEADAGEADYGAYLEEDPPDGEDARPEDAEEAEEAEADTLVSPSKEAAGIAPIGKAIGKAIGKSTGKKSNRTVEESKAVGVVSHKQKNAEMVISESYFLNRLKRLDPNLFKNDTGKSSYSTKCAANWDRQPAILDEAQYQRMIDIYRDDADLGIITFGTPETDIEVKAAEGKSEKIYVMRYGSDPHNLNYYLCTEYFCILDILPIKSADWESAHDRDGSPKPPKSSPDSPRRPRPRW